MNASEIKRILKRKYGSNDATAIAFEVAHGTGRHANRHVDAVVMDLWPSRGLTLHAMEIKVSVSDLKKELANGAKAEEIAQHCDLFSLVVPRGLISDNRMNDIPKKWGVIEVMSDNVLKFTKPAEKTKARPVDREFMASLLRSVGKVTESHVAIIQQTAHDHVEKEIERRVKLQTDRMSPDAAHWREFKELVGDTNYTSDQNLLEAVRLVMRSGLENPYNGVRKLGNDLAELAARIAIAADTVKLKKLEPKQRRI